MRRETRTSTRRTVLVLAGILLLAGAGAGVAQKPSQPPGGPPDGIPAKPAAATVVTPAPQSICALLDSPAKRQIMDGLLFNLLWSCGRQNELGQTQGPKAEGNASRLAALAYTVTDVQVNDSTGESGSSATQSETSIAQNPETGTFCSAFNDSWEFYGGGGGFTGFARSTDGGSTWVDGGAVNGRAYGDPSLVWRRADGNFYLAALDSGGGLGLYVSTDDCQTFSFVTTPSTFGDDKEILAVDNNLGSPYFGNLYVVWTDFGVGGAPIRASRSTDGGVTWWPPVTLSSGGAVQGAWPAVAPNGDLFVAWLHWDSYPSGPIDVEVSRSTDGGVSYSRVTNPLNNAVNPRDAATTGSCGRPALNGPIRYLPSPQIVVDDDGVLHVVYSYDPDGYATGDVVDVFYRRSLDNGASWLPEVRLNDDASTSDQYFPTIQVSGSQVSGSTVLATWYDRRNDPANYMQEYFKRLSYDGGATWQPSVLVSDVPSPVYHDPGTAACYHGDYDQSLISLTNAEVPQWADDRNVLSGHQDPDVWVDPATETYRCVIDVAGGTNTCSGPVSLAVSSGIYRTGRIDLSDGYLRLDAFVDVCSPTGFTMHFADSPTTNGYGGDGGTTNHNAEVHNVGTGIYFYGVDDTNLHITDPIAVTRDVIRASGCYRVHWTIQEDRFLFDDDGDPTDSSRIRLDSFRSFEVPPYDETDLEDPSELDAPYWYFGLNRTYGSAGRTGTGADRACIVLSRTTSPDLSRIASLCN